jgi:hypothetical protein
MVVKNSQPVHLLCDLSPVSATLIPTFSTTIMRTSIFAATLAVTSALAVQLSYDTVYDNKSGSLDTVACSDGSNGLVTKGYSTFGSLKNFPNIGGAFAIKDWNSASCGTCWALTYKNTTINVLAIDVAKDGFNVGLTAMNKITNGTAVHDGIVDVTYKQVNASACGL